MNKKIDKAELLEKHNKVKQDFSELILPTNGTDEKKALTFAPQAVGWPQLGLVCITTSDRVRYRSVTRKRLLKLELEEQQRVLRELYAENLQRLNRAVDFCAEHGIRLYRMTSALFPFADEEVGSQVLNEFKEGLRQWGDRALSLGLRIVLHPDQFVVLSSDNPQTIENSIKILSTHARIMDMMGLPRSPWALMNVHGGKSDRADRLIGVIRDLPEPIRDRLTLENDEYAYSAREILDICRKAEIPMVFDAHHHVIHDRLDSYDNPSVGEMLAEARTTWSPPQWQLVHISNGHQFFNDPRHSDFISQMPISYRNAPWIEVEAKLKEEAIFKLQREWLHPENA